MQELMEAPRTMVEITEHDLPPGCWEKAIELARSGALLAQICVECFDGMRPEQLAMLAQKSPQAERHLGTIYMESKAYYEKVGHQALHQKGFNQNLFKLIMENNFGYSAKRETKSTIDQTQRIQVYVPANGRDAKVIDGETVDQAPRATVQLPESVQARLDGITPAPRHQQANVVEIGRERTRAVDP